MSVKRIKFYPEFAPLIKSGRKTATCRRDTELTVGKIARLITTDGDFIADAKIIAIYPVNTITQSIERLKEISNVDGFDDILLWTRKIKEIYGFPFIGILIEWELQA